MRIAVAVVALCFSACQGGGDWVDAPGACEKIINHAESVRRSFHTSGAHIMTIEEGKALNAATTMKEIMELTFQMVDKSLPQKAGQMRRDFDNAVTTASREACSNAGKSFTGEWECSEEQSRIKCK